jgi:ankyrin repeat protein
MRPIPYCGHTLNEAAASCTPEIFALLLSHGAVLSNARPVHYAAACGQDDRIPMLEYLIEELKIDINELDDALRIPEECCGREGTPLHWALKNQKYETAKWLLEHGADPNKPMTPQYPTSTPRMWVRDIHNDKKFYDLLSKYPVK